MSTADIEAELEERENETVADILDEMNELGKDRVLDTGAVFDSSTYGRKILEYADRIEAAVKRQYRTLNVQDGIQGCQNNRNDYEGGR